MFGTYFLLDTFLKKMTQKPELRIFAEEWFMKLVAADVFSPYTDFGDEIDNWPFTNLCFLLK